MLLIFADRFVRSERSFHMSFLDDVISTTKTVAASAGKKTDEAVQFSKLKIKAAQLNSDIKSKFEKLGSTIYQMAKSDDKNNEEFDALIAEIDECYTKLEEVEAKLDALKEQVTCPGCGAKTKNDNAFCPKCGAKLPETKPAQPAEEEAAKPEVVIPEAESEEKKDEE